MVTLGGAVIASLVFVLGVMVGKRVESRAHVAQTATTSAALDPLAALDKLGREGEELAFAGALSGDPEVADAPLGQVDRTMTKPAGDSPEDRAETAKVAAAKAAAARAAAAKAAAKPADKVAKPGDEGAEAGDEGAAAKPEAGSEPNKKPAKRGHTYTLQLSSFQERAEADSFYGQLTAAGYSPYIVEAEVPGRGIWYRVRLGNFESYNDAITAKKDFEAKQKIIAYVTKSKRK